MRRLLLILYSSLFTLHSSLLHAQLYEQSVRAIVEALAVDSLDKAKGMIEQTIRLDPMRKSNAILYQLYLNRASLYLGLNNDERALADYNKVLEAEPDNEEALFYRAFIHSQGRRYKEARADYNNLLKLNPMHEDARLGLAVLNSKDGRPKEALEQLDALIRFYPTHAKHYLARCGLYEKRKEYEKAKKDIDMAFELEPNSPDCYLTRASLYLAMKKKRLAQQDCRTAIKLGATPEQVASILGALK